MTKFVVSLVLDQLPEKGVQIILLSATIPADSFRNMTKNVMSGNPVKILVKKEQLTLEGIQQFFIHMENENWKLDTLCDLYTTETFTHPTVVFRNTRKQVDALLANLEERELAASATVRIPICC
jgi:translation initiation factor 4A